MLGKWKCDNKISSCLPGSCILNREILSPRDEYCFSGVTKNKKTKKKKNPKTLLFNVKIIDIHIFTSFQFSCLVVSDTLRPYGLQHARPPCPLPTLGVYTISCPLSQWCHPTISFSVTSFSSCLQSFPASGSFPRSQLFASDSQSIGVSAPASVLPMITQDIFSLGWTGLISLQSKRLSRVFPNTTVQNNQFFHAQLSL